MRGLRVQVLHLGGRSFKVWPSAGYAHKRGVLIAFGSRALFISRRIR